MEDESLSDLSGSDWLSLGQLTVPCPISEARLAALISANIAPCCPPLSGGKNSEKGSLGPPDIPEAVC